MDKGQVQSLLSFIVAAYPGFEVNEGTVKAWVLACRGMDAQRVQHRLLAHIQTSRFPPKIADIAAYPVKEKPFLTQMEEWEQEGRERIEREAGEHRGKPSIPWL